MPRFNSGSATSPGRVRSDNEDTFVDESLVFAVADGMGGHQAGEVASALAASIIRDRLGQGAASEDAAVSAVLEANAAIHGAARANAAQSGMGTTLTALAVMTEGASAGDEDRFVLLNVGDSRTYRFRQGKLQRVTVDHSYVQELVATGHITIEEARTHPRRNIVTRALGIEPSVRADMWTLPIVRDDRFILCSDGLVDEVPDDEILQLVASVADPQQLAEQLVDIANRHGGRDNVTVVVVDVIEGADPPDPTDEIAFDPAWAEPEPSAVVAAGAPGAPAWVHDPPMADADGSPVTVADASAVPTVPPPAMPLPPSEAEMNPDGSPMLADLAGDDPTPDDVETADDIDEPPAVTAPFLPSATPRSTAIGAATAINPVAASEPVAVAVAPTEPVVDTKEKRKRPKRRFGFGFFLFAFLLAAIVTVTFTLIAVHARSGYFVGFDGDTVVVYKGQKDSVLWFHPTIAASSSRSRDELEPNLVRTIEGKLSFDTLEEAAAFIDEQVIPTTTTTVPESTTTTTPSPEPPQQTLPGDTTPTSIAGP